MEMDKIDIKQEGKQGNNQVSQETQQGPRVFTVPIVDKSEKNNRNMPTVVFIVIIKLI